MTLSTMPTVEDFRAALTLVPEDAANDTPAQTSFRRVLAFILAAAELSKAIRPYLKNVDELLSNLGLPESET